MAISNELTSEIATALLTAKNRSPEELTKLKSILLEVHSVLQEMTDRSRDDEMRQLASAKSAANGI